MASTVPNSEATQFRAGAEQVEIARKGGIASGEARRENAMMRKTLEMMLEKKYKDQGTYKDNVALGLIANAIDKSKGGNPEAYKVIAKMLGELDVNEEKQRLTNHLNYFIDTMEEGSGQGNKAKKILLFEGGFL